MNNKWTMIVALLMGTGTVAILLSAYGAIEYYTNYENFMKTNCLADHLVSEVNPYCKSGLLLTILNISLVIFSSVLYYFRMIDIRTRFRK